MSEWFTSYRLYRELRLTLNYKTLSPLRIGSSKGKSLFSPIDLQVLRINMNGKEVPYIPGSSLKGVFRSTAESITKSFNIDTCMLGNCSEVMDQNGEKRDSRLQTAIKTNSREVTINILNEYCLCCKIFGSKTYASHIKFNDAYPDGEVGVGVKTGIAINRKSGATKRGALYQVEFVNPDSEFTGEIVMFNLPNYAIGLLSYIINYINSGFIKLGGFKSRGFGRIEIKVKEIDGVVNINNNIKEVSELDVLPALDEVDQDIELDLKNPDTLLNNAKEAFSKYAGANS